MNFALGRRPTAGTWSKKRTEKEISVENFKMWFRFWYMFNWKGWNIRSKNWIRSKWFSRLNHKLNHDRYTIDVHLTLICEFLGPLPSAISEKKIQKHSLWCHSWDVMMIILNGICGIWYANTSRNLALWTNFRAQKHIQIKAMLRFSFFPENALSYSAAFWIFPRFREKSKE